MKKGCLALLLGLILCATLLLWAVRNFDDDFESGDFTAWDSTFGSPTAVGTPTLFGSFAMEVNATEGVLIDTGPGAQGNTIYARFYWRAASPWQVGRMYSFERNNNTPILRLETISGPFRIRLVNVLTGTTVDSTVSINLDTMYRFETEMFIDNSVGTMEFRLYDTPDPGSLLDTLNITNEDTFAGGQTIRHRLGAALGGFAGLWYYDEFGTNDATGPAPDNTFLGPVTPSAAAPRRRVVKID